MSRSASRWLPASLIVCLLGTGTALAQDLDAAARLIREGQSAAAYAELAPHEAERAGDPRYDYLLGLAALENGQAALATVAFERVLAVQPQHLGARLDMARAHFQLGQDSLAREELETLRGMDPPPAARRAIDTYLQALDRRADPTRWQAWVEAGLGYDTNVNNATSAGALFVPALGASVSIATSSTARQDLFAETRAGASVRHRVSPRFSLLAGGDAGVRWHDDVKDLDTADYGGYVGAETRFGQDTVTASVRYGRTRLDYDPYRDNLGLELLWRRPLSPRTALVSFAQHSALRYQQAADKPNDSNLFLAGVGLQHALDEAGTTVVSLGGFGGVDDAVSGRSDGDRNLVGVRAAAQHSLRHDVDVFASGSAQVSSYHETNPLFQVERVDHLYGLGAGVSWRFLPGWSLRSEVAYSRNKSNTSTNDYTRTELGVRVRRSFE